MRFRQTLLTALVVLCFPFAIRADPPHRGSGINGGGHHALTGGGHHALGGGVHYHSGAHHHHHGGYHLHGGGYYGGYYGGGYGGFSSLYYGPGFFSYSSPGYSFFSGTTTVLPSPAWSSPVGGGYSYGAPGYYLDPYGPVIERPGHLDPIPADERAVFDEWLDENRRAWEDPVDEMPIEQLPERFIAPSSSAAVIRSIRFQHEGDLHLKNLQYNVAARRYQDAITAAPDRAEPYFRMAVAQAADGDFEDAVLKLKQGLQIDAGWPATATTLSDLTGEDNLLARTLIKQRVADWTREDVRDPDRLFLLGVLLHLERDDRGLTLFESAARLSGMQFHLAAFLRGDDLLQQAQAEAETELPPPVLPPPPGGGDDSQTGPSFVPPLPAPPTSVAPSS